MEEENIMRMNNRALPGGAAGNRRILTPAKVQNLWRSLP
jgi:hypothetical protein